ncbi:response regulator [Flavobacterium sp. MAH-1]|uniref:Response regulator n=1 Tax=Flavobacterium agri TaxID=2743471 RepID=A0A7Y8XYU1_9FLAO|nr:response regulator [Flavobacterium agri]NUY79436.1 response regulator [Flavobacterium agri]NYA69461.1 response regulator [Flavobacterium agri]
MKPVKAKILLADDDEDDRLFFKDALESLKMDTEVDMVHDGEKLLEYLEDDSNELPHILFLDLNMPCKNGFECLDAIRQSTRLKDMTVAIYSTSGDDRDIETAFVKGANVYIRKPSDFDMLKKTLSEVLNVDWQFRTGGLNKDTFLFSI